MHTSYVVKTFMDCTSSCLGSSLPHLVRVWLLVLGWHQGCPLMHTVCLLPCVCLAHACDAHASAWCCDASARMSHNLGLWANFMLALGVLSARLTWLRTLMCITYAPGARSLCIAYACMLHWTCCVACLALHLCVSHTHTLALLLQGSVNYAIAQELRSWQTSPS